MKRKKNILIATISFVVLSLCVFVINNIFNERYLNEEKAKMYDEYMAASYSFLTDINSSLYIILNTYEKAGQLAKNENNDDYKESVSNFFYEIVDNNFYVNNAYKIATENEVFMSTFVGMELQDGGKLREKESTAYKKFRALWFELTRPVGIEFNDYNSLIERINLFRKTLAESFPAMKGEFDSYSSDKNAWRRIGPKDKLYIWEKYRERKNWPFTFFK